MNDTAPRLTVTTGLAALPVLAAFGTGLFFSGYQDIHYAPAALCLLAFACITIIPAFRRGLAIPAAPVAGLVFAFWLYVTLSLSWSSVPFASLVTYLIFIAGPLVFFGPLLAVNRDTLLKLLATAILAALTLLALWAIIQYTALHGQFGPRAAHPLPNPNNLAGLMTLGLVPALALYLYAPFKSRLMVGALLLALMFLAALFATESHGGLASALIGAALLIIIMKPHTPALWMRLLWLALPAIALFVLLGLPADLRFAERLGRLAAPAADSTVQARLAIWQNALPLLLDHLWLGTGLGTFYLYYAHYRRPGADDSTGNWAHMDPLQYGIEMGVLAPLLFYAIAAAVIIRTVKALKATGSDTRRRALIAGPFCALLAVILHTHATFHLYIMPILIVTGLWLALWYHATAQILGGDSFKTITITPWQRPVMTGAAFIITGLISVMALSAAWGQHHFLRAHELIRQGQPAQFTAAIETAERYAPLSFIDPEVKLAALYIDLLGKNAAALFSPEAQQSLYLQSRDLLDTAAQMNPAWAEIDYQRGRLYSTADEGYAPDARQTAMTAITAAIRKDPTHARARLLLAELYLKRGRAQDAYEALAAALPYPLPPAAREELREAMRDIEGLAAIQRDFERQRTTP